MARDAFCFVGLLWLLGCACAREDDEASLAEQRVLLSAQLRPDGAVALRWRAQGLAIAGYWLEFATPGTDFTKLALLPAEEPEFVHERVANNTSLLYRVRAIFGEASPAAELELETPFPEAASPLREGPLDEPRAQTVSTFALRSAMTRMRAVPAVPHVQRVSSDAVELRWQDRASDEDGYLVEQASERDDFHACALLAADSTSFRKLALPRGGFRFRVRAFVYGAASNVAVVHTEAP